MWAQACGLPILTYALFVGGWNGILVLCVGLVLERTVHSLLQYRLTKEQRLPVGDTGLERKGVCAVCCSRAVPPDLCPCVQIHVEHFAERVGLWVMLVMGESMISLITSPVVQDSSHYLTLFYSLGLVFLIQHLYFEAQPSHADQHALRYDPIPLPPVGLFFMSCHHACWVSRFPVPNLHDERHGVQTYTASRGFVCLLPPGSVGCFVVCWCRHQGMCSSPWPVAW